VAIAFAVGPAAGLELVDALTSGPSLKNYYLLSAVSGDLLICSKSSAGKREFKGAAALTRNSRECSLLLDRAAACSADPPAPVPGEVGRSPPSE
jgi:predicted RNA polymerase sigma factor